ncbi:MAG: putative oxidoreductase [Ilumatobacteraceae bacterium]|nr:putative oxidoreductase [Ilumatobacteraceae bacterium]
MSNPTPPELPSTHVDLITAPTTVVLSTVNNDGTPQSTLVWSALFDGVITCTFAATRQKIRNLRRRPLATLLYTDSANPYRTLEVRADVDLTDDDDERSMTRKVISSYGVAPETMPAALTEERVIVRFTPRRVVTMG